MLFIRNLIKDITKELSDGSNYVTASLLYLSIYCLVTYEIPKVILKDQHLKRLKQDILLSINVRFSFLLDSNKLENLFMTISFLNPRFRKFNFISDEKERKNKLD